MTDNLASLLSEYLVVALVMLLGILAISSLIFLQIKSKKKTSVSEQRSIKEIGMDPISLIFGIAASVFSNIVADFITGALTSATNETINTRIEQEWHNVPHPEKRELGKYRQAIFGEVENLAQNYPYLEKRGNGLTLRNTPAINRATYLQQIAQIVNLRRQELGLPIIESGEKNADVAHFEWVSPNGDQGQDDWERDLVLEMRDRIRRQRRGENISDE